VDIELLINYIQDKGYQVGVIPHTLIIYKYAHDLLYSNSWMISPFDLQPQLWDALTDQADRRIAEIEQAIAAHVQ